MMEELPAPRFVSRGRTYVYLLPCRDEDLLKIGLTQAPLHRMRSFHRRYFDLFDLGRGWLLELDRLSQARTVERHLLRTLVERRSPPPLVVAHAAGGYTEWHRGVYDEAEALLRNASNLGGHTLFSLDRWLYDYFLERADLLHDWSSRMLEQIEYQVHNVPRDEWQMGLPHALRDTLSACIATGLEPWRWVPPAVRHWYEAWES
jgi:hypothetical protein